MNLEYLLAAVFSVAAVLAQFICLSYAATTTYSDMAPCARPTFDGYAWGWINGACQTGEMVWCLAHPYRHPDCIPAPCRGESVRLALGVTDGSIAYKTCTQLGDVDALREQIVEKSASLRLVPPSIDDPPTAVGPCAPDGNILSGQLPRCYGAAYGTKALYSREPPETEMINSAASSLARCRDPYFYLAHNSSPAFGPAINCTLYFAGGAYFYYPFSYRARGLWNGTGLEPWLEVDPASAYKPSPPPFVYPDPPTPPTPPTPPALASPNVFGFG